MYIVILLAFLGFGQAARAEDCPEPDRPMLTARGPDRGVATFYDIFLFHGILPSFC